MAFEPEHRAIMPALMDGTSEFPSRPEMEEGIRLFAERTGLRVRPTRRRWEGTSTRRRSLRPAHALGRGLPQPRRHLRGRARRAAPARDARHRARRPLRRHPARGERTPVKRLFIIGKQNSGFELASGLLQWASPIVLASPRPAQLSVNLHSLGGVRARYLQPWEDADLGGGVFILDASIERIERHSGGLAVHTRRTDRRRALRGRGRRGHRGDRDSAARSSTSRHSA